MACRSKKWIKKQLYMGFCSLTKSRRLSIWNAFLQQRLRDENEGLFLFANYSLLQLFYVSGIGRNRGDRYRLPDFIRQNKKTLLRAYSKLTPDEKQGLLSHLSIARTTKVKMPRSNPKAIQHDINATFNAMETEVRRDHSEYTELLTVSFSNSGVQSASEQVPKVSTS